MRILHIDDCDYLDFPIGGQLTFAKQLLSQFNNLVLVGCSTNKKFKIGKWTKVLIDGVEYDFLPIIYRNKNKKKPFIPSRITWTIALLRFQNEIKKANFDIILTQNINSLFPALKLGFRVLHVSAGLNNPFKYLRYSGFSVFEKIFQLFWEKQLSKTDLLLVASDNSTIKSFRNNSKYLSEKKIISFPTRYYDEIFYVKDRDSLILKYDLDVNCTIVTFSGRINNVKGWDLLLESFKIFQTKIENSMFVVIGDGEDRFKLEKYAKDLEIYDKLYITGFVKSEVVSEFLNMSDLVVLGSYREGWPTAIVEALACGRNIVSTNVSAVKDMVFDNINGFVLENRNPEIFAEKMINSLKFSRINQVSINSVKSYKVSDLKKEILKLWEENKK